MSSSTLTSLAMLKVNIDRGQDYLDYLRPFILQVLVDHNPDPVTDRVIRDFLRLQFGLEIPDRAVQVVLKRLSKTYPLTRASGVYRITGTIPDPGVAAEKAQAVRHIDAVVAGLIEFSKSTARPLDTPDLAVAAICTFLAEFDVQCLRAFLRGTAIPGTDQKHGIDLVLVSEYVLNLQRTNPERFHSFLILMQGHMLANALLCPDLHSAPATYNAVAFYLDTPLLVQQLGLEGEPKRAAIDSLIDLLINLGGTVAAFSHSRDELERVLRGAAENVDSLSGRGSVILEARRSHKTKSDLLLLVGQIDERLAAARIAVKETPRYVGAFQIDESAFAQALQDEVEYFNPRAKDFDINSVRSIYALRKGAAPFVLEKSKAVLVTSNSGFARAAYQYGQRHEESREVSSVITDFSLANMAWLKAPMGAPSLPMTEVLAFAYAALRPSKGLLAKFLEEMDKLEKQGRISARDHQLLRSSTLAQEELMRLTLGDEAALTEESVTETLRRISSEIKSEESEKLSAEQRQHRETQGRLAALIGEREALQQREFWRCSRMAKALAWGVSAVLFLVLVAGIVGGFGLQANEPVVGWVLVVGAAGLACASLANLVLGSTVRQLHRDVETKARVWLLRRRMSALGIDLSASK